MILKSFPVKAKINLSFIPLSISLLAPLTSAVIGVLETKYTAFGKKYTAFFKLAKLGPLTLVLTGFCFSLF